MESRPRYPLLRALAFVGLGLLAVQCDNPGSVGDAFGPNPSLLKTDTLDVPALQTAALKAYSGNLNYISAGTYDDALFGRFQTSGLLLPGLAGRNDSMQVGARVYLKLFVSSITGDTTANTRFELVEVTRRWRGPTWTLDSTAVTDIAPLGVFFHSPGDGDSLEIDLPSTWVDRYKAIARNTTADNDSLYRTSLFGFLVRSLDDGKILHINAFRSGLHVDNPDTTVRDFRYVIRQSATSLAWTPPATAAPDSVSLIDNSFVRTAYVALDDPGLGADLVPTQGLVRLELEVTADTARMASTLPAGHTRGSSGALAMYVLKASAEAYAITQGPNLSANRNGGRYRFNLTNGFLSTVNNGTSFGRIYLIPDTFDGTIRPAALFNHLSPANRPRLLITRLNSQ